MSQNKTIEYISFDEFVNNTGRAESTIKKRYKEIPGITKTKEGFQVVSGTRYPCDLHRHKFKNSGDRRYALLKAISKYQYVTHKDLSIEHTQFEDMLRELLSAGLIRQNNLFNTYGANAYDCTPAGDELIQRTDKEAKSELINLIASAAGTFTGAVISQIADAA